MYSTEHPEADKILHILLKEIKTILGEKLVGLYLDGSLVIGDYEPGISDIDLIAALSSPITDSEFNALKNMHDNLIKDHKEWYDRIEVCYITVEALKSVRTRTSQIVNISPGEPIHRKGSSKAWIMNWYLAREKGVTLYGSSPKEIIEPITYEEFIQSVKEHARSWNTWVEDMKNLYAQSYAILAICRALFVVKNGEQPSKKQAALWVEKEYPQWSELIQNALTWRHGGKYNPPDDINHPKTVKFVNAVRRLILEA